MTQTQVAKNEKKAVAPLKYSDNELAAIKIGDQQDVIKSDVLLPRLLLMQGTSDFVIQRKAQLAQFVKSTTMEVKGDPENPVEIIPLRMDNTWSVFEKKESAKTTKDQFVRSYPRTAANERDEWEFSEEGKDYRRKKTILLYALLPSDVKAYQAEVTKATETGEAFDLSKTVTPVVITIQSTSFKFAGKAIASFFQNIRAARVSVPTVAAYQYVVKLESAQTSKGTQTWYVIKMDPKAQPLKDTGLREIAAGWVKLLDFGTVKVDDTGAEAEEEVSTGSLSESEI